MKSRSVVVASLASVLACAGSAQAAVMWHFEPQGSQGTLAGSVDVWHVYIQFDGPARVLNVFDANMVTSATMYQTPAPFGSDTAPNSGFFGFDADLQWDTYVTIGDTDSADGNDITPDPAFVMGSNTITGGWFDSDPGSPDGQTDVDDRVFIAQLSLLGGVRTAAPFGGTAFVTYEDQVGGGVVQEEVLPYPTPGTGVLMLAGIGVASQRRREG